MIDRAAELAAIAAAEAAGRIKRLPAVADPIEHGIAVWRAQDKKTRFQTNGVMFDKIKRKRGRPRKAG